MLKILIFILVLYLGYRLFMGPPLLKGQNTRRINKDKNDDDFADYEEIR
jgi:hypothetical protein